MIRSEARLRAAWALLVLNLAVIWGSSLLPGEISGAISGWVRDLIAAILPGTDPDPESGHGLLRKLAHFAEFFCLGMVLSWLLGMLGIRGAFALGAGFLVACTDETIQIFVPDRGPAVTDVLIDTLGVLAGVSLLYWLRRRRDRHKPGSVTEPAA